MNENLKQELVARLADVAMVEIDGLTKQLEGVRAERDRQREVLEKLARLGNEPMYGNSTGNMIAREALASSPVKGEPSEGHGSDCDCDSCQDIDGFSPVGLAASMRELAVGPSKDALEFALQILGWKLPITYRSEMRKLEEADALITARDERIRRECAEKAVAWLRTTRDHDISNDGLLRAAITGEGYHG